MHYLLIACDVFKDVIDKVISQTSHKITPRFLKMEAHLEPKMLHQDIQSIIDEAEGETYDIILLAYGLCGNATDGIKARNIPIVIPRSHDCCTLFLGSIDQFLNYFGENLSASWTSSPYLAKSRQGIYSASGQHAMEYFGLSDDFEDLLREYGEDNAEYLWNTLHAKNQYNTKIFYISTGTDDDEHNIEKLRQTAKEESKEFNVIKGDTSLIKNLLNGKWGREYLFVAPGESIMASNDLETIMKVKKLAD